MLSLPSSVRVYAALGATDMRKSFDTLAEEVRRLRCLAVGFFLAVSMLGGASMYLSRTAMALADRLSKLEQGPQTKPIPKQ